MEGRKQATMAMNGVSIGRIVGAVLGVLCLMLAGAPAARADTKPAWTIVTTTAQVGDIVRNIARDLATVESIMGPGVDPHLYRPTRSDIARLVRADIVFYNGLHLEGQMGDVLDRLGADKQIVAVTEHLGEDRLLSGATGVSRHDPHVWMDVSVWMDGEIGRAHV